MKILSLFLALVCAAAAASVSWGAEIGISNTQALAFGKFVAGFGGTVTISPTGVRTASGGVILSTAGSGTPALFTVSGDPNFTYSVTLPADGTATLVSGAYTMAVNGFTCSPSGLASLGPGGTQTLSVGAAISVGSNQPTGAYSGMFEIMVNYN